MGCTNPVIVLSACIAFSPVTLADETVPSGKSSVSAKPQSTAQDASTFRLRSVPEHPLYRAMQYSTPLLQPAIDLEFQDSSVIGQLSKLRSVSFVTLADSGPTRLYLGVNDDGLLGLHFDLFSKHNADRRLELARMPYLKRKEPEKGANPDHGQ